MKYPYERPPIGPIGCLFIIVISVVFPAASVFYLAIRDWNATLLGWLFCIDLIAILSVSIWLGEYFHKIRQHHKSRGFDVRTKEQSKL